MTNDTLWKEGVLAVLQDGVMSWSEDYVNTCIFVVYAWSNASRTVLLKEIKNAFKGPQHFSNAI